MTSTSNVTPQHQTLLFKSSTHTILLSALPTTPLSSLRRDLLVALASRGISELRSSATGTPIPVPSPDEADRVQLGIAVDRKDVAGKGFRLLRENYVGFGVQDDGGKGKGKARAGTTGGGNGKGKANANDTVVGAGLRDGDVLAFKFRDDEGGKKSNGVNGDDMDILEDGLEDEEEDEGEWDVAWPKYEDEE